MRILHLPKYGKLRKTEMNEKIKGQEWHKTDKDRESYQKYYIKDTFIH